MTLLTKTADVEALCARLRREPYVTVDTEFQRTDTYWPKLALIQVAGQDEAVAIDPLAEGMDISAFVDLLADPKVLKVLHAARQDMEIFFKLMDGVLPAPIFDTQIAAMVCGFGDSVGYDTLVKRLAKATVDKSTRFTDWTRRPLTDKQIGYALGDVIHLRVIYEKLSSRLEKNDRTHWIQEEMDILCSPSTYVVEPQESWLRLKPRSNNRRFLGLVQDLAALREETAQKMDMPRGRVMRDDALMELAAHPPKSPEEVQRKKGLPRNLTQPEGGALWARLQASQQRPDKDLPKAVDKPRRGAESSAALELLKVLLKQVAEKHNVAQRLIASAADLDELARTGRLDKLEHGWRNELFGEDAEALLAGNTAITFRNGEIVVVPVTGETGNS